MEQSKVLADIDQAEAIDEGRSWDRPKVRKCLMCSVEFESSWSGERICKSCKSSSSWKSGGF